MSEALEVTPIKETWGVYELGEGIVLRSRAMLACVEEESATPGAYKLRTALTSLTAAPEELRGTPSESGFDPSREKPVRTYTDVKERVPGESVYLLPNGAVVRLRVRVQEARRYDHINADGEPFIQVSHQVEIMSTPAGEAKLPRIEGPGLRPA